MREKSLIKNKIAVFVEGQGELIFFRKLIPLLLENTHFSFQCLKLHSGKTEDVPYSYPNPDAVIHFMIINVQGDANVLSAIKEREQGLIKKGYSKIMGLRDMYSEAYKKHSNGISPEINDKFIKNAKSTIQSMSEAKKISFHFAIMEIEAWWLSMHSIFQKIDKSLTLDCIHAKLGFKLDEIDPETHFFHPSVTLKKILELVGKSYRKNRDDVESITSHIKKQDIETAVLNGRCGRFGSFIDEIRRFV